MMKELVPLLTFALPLCAAPCLGQWDLSADWVYLHRENLDNQAFIINSNTNAIILHGDKLVRTLEHKSGFRIGAMNDRSETTSLQFSYLRVDGWKGSKEVVYGGALSFPFKGASLATTFENADSARVSYHSVLDSAEINWWRHVTPRFENYFCFSTLLGPRYVGLRERFKLRMTKGSEFGDYKARTKNQLFGMQLGGNIQANPYSWMSWDVSMKAGVYGNNVQQENFLGDHSEGNIIRDYESEHWSASFLTDIQAVVHFKILSWFKMHVEYEALFFKGMALAPEQVRNASDVSAGRTIRTGGSPIIHGASVGASIVF